MKTLIDELKLRKKLIEKLDFNDFPKSLGKIYLWLLSQRELQLVLERLDTIIENNDIFNPYGLFRTPTVSNFDEQAAVGYRISEHCVNDSNLWDIVRKYNLIEFDGPYLTGRVVKKIKEKYVLPFIDYLIQESEKLNQVPCLESEINYRLKMINSDIYKSKYPNINKMVDQISKSFRDYNKTDIWNGIANSCRDLMIMFSKEIRKNYYTKDLVYVKEGDFRNTVKLIVKSKYDNNRFNETLIKLIDSIWQHTNSATHRIKLTRQQALRIFLWTVLIIYEIELFLSENYIFDNKVV